MGLRDILSVLLLWCIYANLGAARGRILDDLELEEELKRLNKPAIEIIQTVYGDTYGCVDFYEQPAFDHPSLKDHKYNYKMPERRTDKDSSNRFHPKNIWLNGKGCPDGTVPIKRTTKDDLIRAKLAAEIYNSQYSPQTTDNPGVHYASLRTNGNYRRFNGASMYTTLYNPKVQDNISQFSGAHMIIRNGNESVEVGWVVFPYMYKDAGTRLFIYTNSVKGNCFNTMCPAFVLTNRQVPVDFVFNQTSTSGKDIYEEYFSIYKDDDWFLYLGDDENELGFWPSAIFKALSDTGNFVEWGGETLSPRGFPSPPMGSGASQLSGDTSKDAYCRQIKYADGNKNIVFANDLATFTDCDQSYLIKDSGDLGNRLGHIAYFGGAGGCTSP